VGVAVSLAIAKLAIGLVVNSMAVIASSVDSLLDLVASSVNLVAIRVALQPPDADHGFGHTKAEGLATALQSLLIGGSAIYLLVEGARRVIFPEALRRPVLGLVVMAVSAACSGLLVLYMRRVATKTQSSALRADSTHYATDVFANLAVLGGVAAVAWTGLRHLDGLLTVGVALYVGASALGLLREATGVLMDEELPAAQRRGVEAALQGLVDAAVLYGWHGLRTRSAGRWHFVEVHLEMDGTLPLSEAHERGDRATTEIKRVLPSAQVLVHLDVERDEPVAF
jgi:ferrous-iron efflux pump FieF